MIWAILLLAAAETQNMLVSVIIPTFNRASKVVEAIRSVQQQTYSNKQIIVIDDGSEDETRQLVEQLSGIEYYYQDNQRQAAARNLGLQHARGDFIATLDSDDVWEKDFLSESVACLEKHNLDFVFSNWQTRKNETCLPSAWERSGIWKKYVRRPAEDWFVLDSREIRELFVKTCPAPSSALLIRRESMVSKWNSALKIGDDWGMILDMVTAKPCRAAFTLRHLWTKNVHDENIYDGRSRKAIASELEIHDTRILKERYKFELTRKEKRIFNLRLAKGYAVLMAYFIKNGLFGEEVKLDDLKKLNFRKAGSKS